MANTKNISQAFDAGNYANAYELNTTDTQATITDLLDQYGTDYAAAWLVGFYSSYELWEIPESDLNDYLNAQAVVGWDM